MVEHVVFISLYAPPKEIEMGFIFEEINKSDAIKYGLDEIVKYQAIDREKEVFIYGGGLAKVFRQEVMDKSDFVNEYVFFLGNKEDRYEVHLSRGKGTINRSELQNNEPWVYVWTKLLKIVNVKNKKNETNPKVFNLVKNGLEVFGGGFQNLIIPNFVVQFNF